MINSMKLFMNSTMKATMKC